MVHRYPSDQTSNTTTPLGAETFVNMEDSTTNTADALQTLHKATLRLHKDLKNDPKLCTSLEPYLEIISHHNSQGLPPR